MYHHLILFFPIFIRDVLNHTCILELQIDQHSIPPPEYELPLEGPKLKEELCDSFDAEKLDDIMEEFKWLEQTESVDMFLGKFKDLKTQMLVRNQLLIESHFVSSFMGGLKENIRFDVKIFKLTSFRFDIEQARMQERAIEATL
ncbi:hypothetical protein R3W88_001140 [Solanum pinnatisectum]|uniref:Uncharacterized protein n=1 Tax=Solanum pinnatisectum TaxID=50273 RepID=A0AAV9MJ13_9SOLN|nr:hypothetical protein R3W88_001140 [Solanum pinnatisectum]